jgi:acetyl-CoA carboxylase/biotin carboxylase 1
MVGWIATLKTPEYPDGRPLAIVANDCTVQSGSFGIQEDNYFDAFSKYARAGGLPRLHIACNSGARIGLAPRRCRDHRLAGLGLLSFW